MRRAGSLAPGQSLSNTAALLGPIRSTASDKVTLGTFWRELTSILQTMEVTQTRNATEHEPKKTESGHGKPGAT